MKQLFDFMTMPFDLPVNPIISWVVMALIGIIAFRLAYKIAGESASSSAGRSIVHWIARIVVFVILWALVCGAIYVYRFLKEYWYWVLAGVIIVAAIVAAILIIKVRKKPKRINESSIPDDKKEPV